MIDIVPRLRERPDFDGEVDHLGRPYGLRKSLEHEAADEIEWLRGERNRLAADLAKAHLDIVAWIKKAQENYRE